MTGFDDSNLEISVIPTFFYIYEQFEFYAQMS